MNTHNRPTTPDLAATGPAVLTLLYIILVIISRLSQTVYNTTVKKQRQTNFLFLRWSYLFVAYCDVFSNSLANKAISSPSRKAHGCGSLSFGSFMGRKIVSSGAPRRWKRGTPARETEIDSELRCQDHGVVHSRMCTRVWVGERASIDRKTESGLWGRCEAGLSQD